MLFLALITATLASSNQPISSSTRALEWQMLSQVEQSLQALTQSDIDTNSKGFPVKVTPGDSIQKVRQAMIENAKQLIQEAEAQSDPNAAVRQLYKNVQGDDHWPSTQDVPESALSKDEKIAFFRSAAEKYIAALTQKDVDTTSFRSDLHVTPGTPVEEVRRRMRANLEKVLKQAESDSQFLDVLYKEAQAHQQEPRQQEPVSLAATPAVSFLTPYSGPTADELYKYDVARAENGFKTYHQDQLVRMSSTPFFKNHKLDNVPADRLADAEFEILREYLRKARDNNDFKTLNVFSREG